MTEKILPGTFNFNSINHNQFIYFMFSVPTNACSIVPLKFRQQFCLVLLNTCI